MSNRSMSWPRIGLGLVLALGLVPAWLTGQTPSDEEVLATLPADVQALLTSPSMWSKSVTLSSGTGYKDNLLLSSQDPESSGFVRSGVEAFVLRTPESGNDFTAFFTAESTRFFSRQSVNGESQVFVHGEWCCLREEKLKVSLAVQAYFLDQVFDVSDTEAQRSVAQMKVLGGALTPGVRWMFVPACWADARGVAKRETFHDGQNNNEFFEGELRLGWKLGPRLEVSIGGFERRRDFDRREQYSERGRPQAGTRLKIAEREGEVRAIAQLDSARHWKSVTRAGRQHYSDNGSDYFGYHESKLRQEIEWTEGRWLARIGGSARRLVYTVQTIGLGVDPPARFKEAYTAELRVERKIKEHWTAYAEYSWERNRSNNELVAYRMNEGLLGVQWSWEK